MGVCRVRINWVTGHYLVSLGLALKINTEKARSELIIMQVLLEARRLVERPISLFSGVEFTVDLSVGLNGYCDYILSSSPEQIFIKAPVLCMVEAKNLDPIGAYPQCMAEMIAAQRFNAKQSNPIEAIWGVTTTGSIWRFLRLIDDQIVIDSNVYLINPVGKILGILRHILKGNN